jgi:hypothetical protein
MKNARETMLFGSAVTLLLLLGGCSGGFSAAPYAFNVGLDPNPLGYEVATEDDGTRLFTIPGHVLSFASKAGAVGVTVEGFEVEYFEASRNEAFPGDSVARSGGSLNVYVPPGVICDALRADSAFDGCTASSPGAVFTRGPTRFSPSTTLLPLEIAAALDNLLGIGGAVGAYANVTFYGTDDLQRPFRTAAYQFAVIAPVGE